ncbi:uncharacterized protein PHACADRAFT_210703 [Phanerochaete carnosa HHB-10118-sp]|uniref:Fungal-type protein kinase domain-containing protein n=1 Tax=Phanerochaete carnosa (strain HHB-10118-sp) TaxID=650164 RepID=K5WRD5_PHACS|nr:uncharacterized protein PHACADRAFT_210703 [Phanerochaete carnosa HHB-10118-sp]EKM52937.1 hypothetical protein PHACADRAFT_210703 [Phanerochaete carnosa HHB-10118-sp]
MYGSNPLPVDAEAAKSACKSIQLYESPPEVPTVDLPESFELEDAKTLDGVPAFIISADCWDAPRLLKVYPFAQDHAINEADVSFRGVYDAEVNAYAYLLRHGGCAKEVVPMCFGRVALTTPQVEQILTRTSLSDAARTTLRQVSTLGALLLEHITDGQFFTMENITNDLASRALQALYEVHVSLVCHGALSCRNVLFLERKLPPLPDDPHYVLDEATSWTEIEIEREKRRIRVVWFNFGNAVWPGASSGFSALDLFQELRCGWELFYRQLLPAKRIGYAQAFES